MTTSSDPLRTAAQTAWGEARGDGATGMQAVLNVIGNRAAYPRNFWGGPDILSVCLAKDQFSCWIENSVPGSDYQAMLAVTPDDPQFEIALALAAGLLAGTLEDITGGADSYYADSIPPPAWVKGAQFTRQVGHQLFYVTRPAGMAAQPVVGDEPADQETADLTAAIEGGST